MSRTFKWIFLPVLFGLIIGISTALYGEFYRYIDKKGEAHYVDDMVKIPPEYRDQLKTYDEPLDHLSEEEKMALKKKEELQESLNTNVLITGNNVVVPVSMTYKGKEVEVFLVLDTGASITTLHKDIADQLDIKDKRKATARVAGGKEISFDIAKIDSVKVGPFEEKDLLVGIVDYQGGPSPYNGLLGMNFLQHYKYIIDYENQVIRWNPRDDSP